MSTDKIAIDDPELLQRTISDLASTGAEAVTVSQQLTAAATATSATPATDPGDCADIVAAYVELTAAIATALTAASTEAAAAGDGLTGAGTALVELQDMVVGGIDHPAASVVKSVGQ